jgi:excisionase family DNA binding protein
MSTPTPDLAEQLLKIDQVAEFFNVNIRTVRNMVASGKLIAYNVGTNHILRFRPSDVEAAMERISP